MSLVSDFNADCPLNVINLEKWLREALTEIEKSKTFMFDGINVSGIIAKQKNATINDVCSVSDFNKMFNAVKNGNTIKLVIDDSVYIVPSANITEIESDGYKYVCFNFIGTFYGLTGTHTMKVFKIGIEMISDSLRLCDKSITAFTT